MLFIKNIYLPIEILVQVLIHKFLITSRCMTVVTDQPFHIISEIPYRYIVSQDNGSLVDSIYKASEEGCSDFIIRLTKPEEFMMALDKATRKGNARRSDRKIIFLPSDLPDETNRQQLLDIFKMRETSFVIHVLLVVPYITKADCKYYDLVSHKFVGPDSDTAIYLDRWNSCSSSFEKNTSLFSLDLSNMEGKVVKVACFTYTPYVLLDLDTSLASLGRDGVEMRIMEEFCRWVNCTVEIEGVGAEEWGEVYENYTGLGVIGRVVEDRADFGITALYSWYEEYLYLDFSIYSIRTAVTCITPSPRLIQSWAVALLPFSLYMWFGLMFTFLYSAFALLISQQFPQRKIFLTTFALLITQSVSESDFRTWRIRSVVGWVMVAGLVLDNAYGAGLAATFTIPQYESSIDTIQDVVNRKLPWGATHDAWVFSLTLSQDPLIKQLVSQFHTYNAEHLKRLSFTRKFGFSIERLPAGYFAIGDYITAEAVRNFTVMLQDFYYEYCVVMMRKSSPYTEKLNQHIGRLHESGLMLSWETQVALNYLNYKVQMQVKLSRSKHDVEKIEPLNFWHVSGVFVVLDLGILLAAFVLIGEIIVHKIKNSISARSTLP